MYSLFRSTPAAAALAFALSLAAPAARAESPVPAFDRDGPLEPRQALADSDLCRFFRGQAFHKAITDYTHEMLWACEEIARRRNTGVPLGDRLEATAALLVDYRDAVVAAGSVAVDSRRREGRAPWALGLTAEEKYAIADATGTLLALEAIRSGF
jgi:hypothetical protein